MRIFALALLCVLAIDPAAAKDTGLIFVSNEKSNNIIVIDPNSYKVVKDIKVGRRPRDLHFNADHTKLYVACGDDDVIDDSRRGDAGSHGQAQDRAEPGGIRHRRDAAAHLHLSGRGVVARHHRHGPRRDPEGSADRRRARGRAAQRGRQDPLRHLGGRRPRPRGGYRRAARSPATWSSACARGALRRHPTARTFG